ncbi:MAG: P1 family peptidase [Trueperaceae bacterium]|nr:P1 family peptidase [Trueperaceae bacterium]
MTDAPTRRPRARDLGVPFDGTPGRWNAITDVPGVEVGHRTLIAGRHDDPSGGPVLRTGVTAIHPAGRDAEEGVTAGRFVLNGMGEMTGSAFLDEYGVLYGPMAITNTLSVGVVRDALIAWSRQRCRDAMVVRGRTKPVVSETWDGRLSDVYGQHVTAQDAWRALDDAGSGPVTEGNVGGGTGSTSFGFKAGIGTASRRVVHRSGRFVLGALVQANFGTRRQLRIAGAPVGRELREPVPFDPQAAEATPGATETAPGAAQADPNGDGSIVVILATDAPLLPSQATSLAKRASLGLGRVGSIAAPSSGDLFLAFSTANRARYGDPALRRFESLPTETLDPAYQAAVEATEEAIVNALVAARPMTGVGGATFPALPHDRLVEVLRRYGRSDG